MGLNLWFGDSKVKEIDELGIFDLIILSLFGSFIEIIICLQFLVFVEGLWVGLREDSDLCFFVVSILVMSIF